jgi:DNA-binding transcriptional ArsR family regulator
VNADLDSTLAALADRSRRSIVELLREKPRRPSEIADLLSMTRPALSRHLRVLRDAGLVRDDLIAHDARARLLELRREPFAELRSWVEEVEGFWADQLSAFKAHAERAHALARDVGATGSHPGRVEPRPRPAPNRDPGHPRDRREKRQKGEKRRP